MGLNDPVARFRGGISKGLKQAPGEAQAVSLKGGKYGFGYISGLAVISRGEALGHDLWIDSEFIGATAQALEASGSKGLKSRFTHPDISGDGLAKGLGRVVTAAGSSSDVVRGTLHFWESSTKSPDGNLRDYLATRAKEDPEGFGASIVFNRDLEAERAFFVAHGGVILLGPFGEEWDATNFKSPDPLNVENYPHARLLDLCAVDVVDDPAANPDGLFHRDEKLKEAEGLLEYALGLSDRRPVLSSFDLDPDRAGGFVRRFLSSRGLSIMKLKTEKLSAAGVLEDEPIATDPAAEGQVDGAEKEKKAEDVEAEGLEGAEGEAGQVDPAEPKPEPEAKVAPIEPATSEGGALSSRDEARAFLSEFGEVQGARYFAAGLSLAQARAEYLKALKAENADLKKKLRAKESCESAPLSSGGGDERDAKSKKGIASRFRLPESSKN